MDKTLRGALFEALRHGDAEHQAWLAGAIDAFFDGLPPPPVRGGGNKEAEIARLKAKLLANGVEP